MKLGIKTGLKSDWKTDLTATKPYFTEIWFNATIPEAYTELIQYAKSINCRIGLHFWGTVSDNVLCNLAYPDGKILEASRKLVRSTIDFAKSIDALYVNIHPVGSVLSHLNLDTQVFEPFGAYQRPEAVLPEFKKSLTQLATYAAQQQILLTVESAPRYAMITPSKDNRLQTCDIGEFQLTHTAPLIEKLPNIYFANDFGHSLCNFTSPDRKELLRELMNYTTRLAPKTKLLHVSYLIPPYNGTDYHGNLFHNELQTDAAIPNYAELKDLLKLYKNRDDVYALVEPEKDHIKNYQTLQKIVSEIT